MKIQLRSPELAKRIATDFEKRYRLKSDRSLSLDVVATQYGYDSWQQLALSVSPTAPDFVFDQDMPEEQFAERRVQQARAIAKTFKWLLPDAFTFANSIGATADQSRPFRALHVTDPAYERAMLDQVDVYWMAESEMEHPLAPPGFDLCTLVSVSALAKQRLAGEFPSNIQSVQAIIPWNQSGMSRLLGGKNYFTLDQVLLVDTVPWGFVFDKKSPPSVSRSDLWPLLYKSAADAKYAVAQDHSNYVQLLAAVDRLGLKCKRGEQPQLVARKFLGKPWYWPIKPVVRTAVQRELWRRAERIPMELAADDFWRDDPGRSGVGLRDLDFVIPG